MTKHTKNRRKESWAKQQLRKQYTLLDMAEVIECGGS